ncbi:MAG TPA: cbb3-type cytochrome oxidase assembly protein CcoS [Thermomonas sp.]|nr:cbb3-type cytochrome oxidase assembly protein CcoS [Thermomonas sp.]
MNILLFLIPISLVMIGAAALLFAWAVKHGQFEDLDTPALDILRDDGTPAASTSARASASASPAKPAPGDRDAG